MYGREEIITPEIAKAYLRHNKKNRNLRRHDVRMYAKDMKHGKWQLSPQGVSFYENGDLADGQHRLEAVIEADCPVKMWVMYDVPNDCTIFDYGAKRTPHDILKMSGVEATTYTVALSRFLFRAAGVQYPTIQMIHDFVSDNVETLFLAIYCTSHGVDSKYNITRKASTTAAAFCALYCGMDSEWVDRFFSCVNSGEYDLSKGESASNFLRNWILRNYTGKTDSNREETFYQSCFACKDFCTQTNRKLEYKVGDNVPFWSHVKKELICKYASEYNL